MWSHANVFCRGLTPPRTSAAKPELVCLSHPEFTAGAARRPDPRAPARRASGTAGRPATRTCMGRARGVPPTRPRAARTPPHTYLRRPAPSAWRAASSATAAPHSARLRDQPPAPSGALRAPLSGRPLGPAPAAGPAPANHRRRLGCRPPRWAGLLPTQLRPRRSSGQWTRDKLRAECHMEGGARGNLTQREEEQDAGEGNLEKETAIGVR